MARKTAVSAILTALALVFLITATLAPSGKIALMALVSVCATITVAECGVKYGWTHYLAVSLLGLLLVPKKGLVLLYVAFLGYYPILKMYLERCKNLVVEWILKVLVFNAFLVLFYWLFRVFFLPTVESAWILLVLQYLPLVLVAAEIIFVIYDLVLSYIVMYYYQFLQSKIRGGKWE